MNTLLNSISVSALKAAYHAELKQLLGHVELVRRLDRAYDMLTRSNEYTVEIISRKPLTFHVVSPNARYAVVESEHICTCPDAEKLCKHRLACRLLMRAQVAQRNAQTPKQKDTQDNPPPGHRLSDLPTE